MSLFLPIFVTVILSINFEVYIITNFVALVVQRIE